MPIRIVSFTVADAGGPSVESDNDFRSDLTREGGCLFVMVVYRTQDEQQDCIATVQVGSAIVSKLNSSHPGADALTTRYHRASLARKGSIEGIVVGAILASELRHFPAR